MNQAETFEEAEIATADRGLVLAMNDGSQEDCGAPGESRGGVKAGTRRQRCTLTHKEEVAAP